MRFYKVVNDGYIFLIGIGHGGVEISESEYNTIMNTIRTKPTPRNGFDYRLKEDLSWEEYELEPIDLEPTLEEKAESYDILIGEQTEVE